jgi:hypothetical protein
MKVSLVRDMTVFIFPLYTCGGAELSYKNLISSNGKAIVLNVDGSAFCLFLKVGNM